MKRAHEILEALRRAEKAATELAAEKGMASFTIAARKIGTAGDLVETWIRTQPEPKEEPRQETKPRGGR